MQKILDAIVDALLWIPRKLFELLMDGLGSLIEMIPVPSWFADATGYSAGIPAEIVFWVSPFELGYGVTVIMSAYLLRFIIRRLPIIG
jgi:hypothetical protein